MAAPSGPLIHESRDSAVVSVHAFSNIRLNEATGDVSSDGAGTLCLAFRRRRRKPRLDSRRLRQRDRRRHDSGAAPRLPDRHSGRRRGDSVKGHWRNLCTLLRSRRASWHALCMSRRWRRGAISVLAVIALALGGGSAKQTTGAHAAVLTQDARPKVTNRCPLGALPLRRADLPALRRFGVELAPHGVHREGSHSIDYRDAHAKATFPTFYTGYVRSVCPRRLVRRVIARTADVSVDYRHVTWSASLSYSVFLVSHTPHGLVGWAQMH